MGRLFYKPENAWVGDLIPYYENGTYYGFYLHDPRIRDKEYAEDTTWHLIETKDFVNLDYKGESIARGGIHDANKNACRLENLVTIILSIFVMEKKKWPEMKVKRQQHS